MPFRDYSKNKICPKCTVSPWPLIIWDNVLNLGYKHRIRCGFKANTCAGIRNGPNPSQSLFIVGTLVTDDDLLSLGFPTTYKTPSTGGPTGCIDSVCGCEYKVSDVWKYTLNSGNLILSYSGVCDGTMGINMEVFKYNSATEQWSVSECASTGFGYNESSKGQNGVRGSITLEDGTLKSYLYNTKNILVAVFDDNGGCGNGGCNYLTITLNYNSKSKNYYTDLDKDCGGRCNNKKKGSCRTTGGGGILGGFACETCLKALEKYNSELGNEGTISSQTDDNPAFINTYAECLSTLPTQCGSLCCKFFFPCGTTVTSTEGPTDSVYCLRIGSTTPCMNPNDTPANRYNNCKSNIDCKDRGCCFDFCGDIGLPVGQNFTDIISWDQCPGNFKGVTTSNNYSFARTNPEPDFVSNGCSCGSKNFESWCFKNPKTDQTINWSTATAAQKTAWKAIKYQDLYNGKNWNSITQTETPCVDGSPCEYPELLSSDSFYGKLVFQTCIDVDKFSQ
jgi:hypothetical protein